MASDALIKLLNQHGYQPILLPMTGLKPPDLYNSVRQPYRRLVRRGPLLDCLPPDIRKVIQTQKLFEPSESHVADIEGKQTTGKNISGAVDFLSKALSCIGIEGAPKLDLSFAGGREITFSFSGISYHGVDPTKIGPIIKSLRTDGIDEQYVRDGRLHIVYGYLYSRELNLQRSDAAKFEHDVSAANVGSYLNVGTKGRIEVQGQTRIRFSAADSQPAAFACKAGRLDRSDEGRWDFYPEEVTLSAEMSVSAPYVVAPGVILPVEPTLEGTSEPRRPG